MEGPKTMQNACYRCVHRRTIMGDCHSRCAHPYAQMPDAGSVNDCWRNLDIQGAPHGIANHWFAWPFNFDPIWLRYCSGFEEVPVEDAA